MSHSQSCADKKAYTFLNQDSRSDFVIQADGFVRVSDFLSDILLRFMNLQNQECPGRSACTLPVATCELRPLLLIASLDILQKNFLLSISRVQLLHIHLIAKKGHVSVEYQSVLLPSTFKFCSLGTQYKRLATLKLNPPSTPFKASWKYLVSHTYNQSVLLPSTFKFCSLFFIIFGIFINFSQLA